MQVSRSELILGGQKSGKSRRAELLARDWLAQSPAHHALLIATAQPWDGEMRVLMGMRWHHISNARSSGAEDNPSRDGAMLYVGLAMPF